LTLHRDQGGGGLIVALGNVLRHIWHLYAAAPDIEWFPYGSLLYR
jgi:hypothetical protein